VSEIEALVGKVESLSASADWWNKAMLVCLALTAVAAVVTFIATRQVVTKTSQAAEAQKELSDAKDRALQADLRSKDGEIINAKERTSKLEKEAEELRQQNLSTDTKLELEKGKRLRLAASLLDRTFSDQSGAIEKLSDIPPVEAVFEFPDEREPQRMAEQINFVLANLRWKTRRRRPNDGAAIRDGITISTGMVGQVNPPKGMSDSDRRKLVQRILGISKELADLLRKCGIDAWDRHDPGPIRAGLPENVVLIRVGNKPNPTIDETLLELGPQPEPTPLSGFKGIVGVAPGSTALISGARTPIASQ